MKFTLALMILLLLPALCSSQTTHFVPDDVPTIQNAIDSALNGDTVIVRPGIYVENIDFFGKPITVQSEQGAAGSIAPAPPST